MAIAPSSRRCCGDRVVVGDHQNGQYTRGGQRRLDRVEQHREGQFGSAVARGVRSLDLAVARGFAGITTTQPTSSGVGAFIDADATGRAARLDTAEARTGH